LLHKYEQNLDCNRSVIEQIYKNTK